MKAHLSRSLDKVVPYCYGHFLRMLYFKKEVSGFLRGVREGAILDAGCGFGDLAIWVARKYPKVKVVGVDIDRERIAVCKQKASTARVPNVSFACGDLLNLDFDEEFNFAYCVDVLEHIKEDWRVVEGLYRALKKQGVLVLHTPALPLSRFTRGAAVKRFDLGHVRKGYSFCDMQRLLVSAGFEIEKHRFTFGYAGAIASAIFSRYSEHSLLRVVLFPIVAALAFLDFRLPHRSKGDGLMMRGKKS